MQSAVSPSNAAARGPRAASEPADSEVTFIKMTLSAQTGRSSPQTVRQFLASLQPPLDELAPILAQGGIRNTAHLESFIAMTEAQQRAVLERLPLTVFQVQMICNALEQYQECR